MASKRILRPRRTTTLSTGMVCVLLGLASFALSHGRDGFDKGLFQGMTIALMVLGAYLLGSTLRKGSGGGTWLPSRDEH